MGGRSRAVLVGGLLAPLVALAAGCNNVASANLRAGDCFNQGVTTDEGGSQVPLYTLVDCAQAHDGEVFSVFRYPDPPTAFPGYEAIGAVQQARCGRDFTTFVGISDTASEYLLDYLGPTEQTWATGDRELKCLLESSQGGKLTGTAQGTKK